MDYAEQYRQMPESGKRFPGYSLGAYVDAIAALVAEHRPERMLDYGSGKGFQYLVRRYHERWGGILPYCYDIGIQQLSELPDGPFGGVLCTDVLEHIEEGDLGGVIRELLSLTAGDGFLFLGISCRPTRKTLPSGGDVHRTIRPPSWWKLRLANYASLQPHDPRVVAHWDIKGHFDEPDTPWDSRG